MARPKLNTPPKSKLTLTPDMQTRDLLTRISEHEGKSITRLVEEWAQKDAAQLGLIEDPAGEQK